MPLYNMIGKLTFCMSFMLMEHITKGVSPFLLLYGRHPTACQLATQQRYDLLLTWHTYIQARPAKLHDFVPNNPHLSQIYSSYLYLQ